ncbi:hypothetical protein [Flavobacterium eburneipallidum]|uniref:hypothetical protein n=1 Tax=Flavobacterium eburneipallidum TaxID=3003263 RepID=UPI002482A92F|nr:hypothetical protein [Flavobacterium eburneipallidum]
MAVYKNIQNYSQKNKLTKSLHKLIFKPINPKKRKSKDYIQHDYQQYEGKIVRNIDIVSLDPFGYSEIDSNKQPRNWIEKTGNSIHINTKNLAIKNVLLIKKNKPLDSLLVKESVRLIRAQSYISRVSIKTQTVGINADSVDVFIRVIDSWSLLPRGSITDSKSKFKLTERNFIGTGHTLNTQYQNRFQDGKSAYDLEYLVPNIKNTFIQTRLNYFNDLDGNFGKIFKVDRPFYSPFAKWGGGINIDQQFRRDTLQDANSNFAPQRFKYNSQDLWGGYSYLISEGKTENDRVTNLIVSGRFLHINYLESPTIAYDSINFYSSERFFLAGIGISTRKFVQDKYIFRNGITEDVPIGKIYGITGGYQFKNHTGRLYLGARVSFGNYHKWGFLSTNFELGTFFEQSVTNQTAFSFQANYFTNLIDIGKWKIRQFVKPQLVIGINRQDAIGDQLSINNDYGIKGFKSAIYGNQKALLTFQTQSYSPWNIFGFRLNPFLNYTIAMLGDSNNQLGLNRKTYSKLGVGLIIVNDYLVFRTFQISLAYYPTIPGDGRDVLKTNAFETSDFGLQNFELDKPRTVIYK